jgi:exoribonuclease II
MAHHGSRKMDWHGAHPRSPSTLPEIALPPSSNGPGGADARDYTRRDLAQFAERAMHERGLKANFEDEVLRQLDAIQGPSTEQGAGIRDLTGHLWCSIDNDESRDLDQLTVSDQLKDGSVSLWVAIADVDTLVPKDSPLDQHARANTTSVYTGARIFSMLPEKLSTDFTSMNEDQVRLAVVTEMVFLPNGTLERSQVFRARVHNKARLSYDSTAAWIMDEGPLPAAAAAVPGMDKQLRTQDTLAQTLRALRRERGALDFQTFQPKAVFDNDRVVDVRQQEQNRARQLIEEFMIATNGVTALYLAGKQRASIRRVVRSPERWARIVEVAVERGDALPMDPDPAALEAFLARQRQQDPLRFPDLSLTIVKLMGAGEYVVEMPGGPKLGHFGLAVRDYAHATAPNRRFPDLITQRLLKAAIVGAPPPYSHDELTALAAHCSRQEDAANKVERQLRKSEAALLLQQRLGQTFDGVVTGVAKGNTWVRIFAPHAEGMLRTREPVRVGQRVRVRLQDTDVPRGFIDFALL